MRRTLVATAACLAMLPVWAQTGPMVGDPIAVDIDLRPGERVEMEPIEGIEVVGRDANGLIVRGFRPGPATLQFVITDESGATRTVDRQIEIASVLHPDDDLEPAPLAPPIPPSPNRKAWAAIGLATVAALGVWLQLLLVARRSRGEITVSLSAADEFLEVIERVKRMSPSDERFWRLSDATRKFLSRVDPDLGRELTSTEVIERLESRFPERVITEVRDVLSEGDYAKFSPWGGRSIRFDSIIEEANDLASLEGKVRQP